jgi:hypothetical protein
MMSMLIASFGALPPWKKALLVGSLLMIWPFALFVGFVVLLSSIPIFLFGRWEGELGERPLLHEAEALAERLHAGTAKHYGPAHAHAV